MLVYFTKGIFKGCPAPLIDSQPPVCKNSCAELFKCLYLNSPSEVANSTSAKKEASQHGGSGVGTNAERLGVLLREGELGWTGDREQPVPLERRQAHARVSATARSQHPHTEYLGITYLEFSNADRSSALGLRLNQQNKMNNK